MKSLTDKYFLRLNEIMKVDCIDGDGTGLCFWGERTAMENGKRIYCLKNGDACYLAKRKRAIKEIDLENNNLFHQFRER